MLQYCIRPACSQRKTILLPLLHKEIIRNKFNFSNCNILRHLSTSVKEDSKLERIYYGPLTPQIKAVKIFSLSSSMAGLVAQPIIINEASTIGSTSLLIAICSVVGFFTFITPILLHIVTKKYVTEIHYNPDESIFKATTITFFLTKKQLEFKAEDVVVPDIPGMFTTLHAKGKPLFVEARHFTDPLYYVKMMGYDKPMDFKLGDQEEGTESTK